MSLLDELRDAVERRGKVPYVGAPRMSNKRIPRQTEVAMLRELIDLHQFRVLVLRREVDCLAEAMETGVLRGRNIRGAIRSVQRELEVKRHRLFALERKMAECQRRIDFIQKGGSDACS